MPRALGRARWHARTTAAPFTLLKKEVVCMNDLKSGVSSGTCPWPVHVVVGSPVSSRAAPAAPLEQVDTLPRIFERVGGKSADQKNLYTYAVYAA